MRKEEKWKKEGRKKKEGGRSKEGRKEDMDMMLSFLPTCPRPAHLSLGRVAMSSFSCGVFPGLKNVASAFPLV